MARVEAQLEDVRNFLQVGLVPPNDVLTVEAERISTGRALDRGSQTASRSSRADLRRLLDLPAGTIVELVSRLDAASLDESSRVELLIEEATTARADRTGTGASAVGRGCARRGQRAPVSGPWSCSRVATTTLGQIPASSPGRDTWQRSWDASVSLSWRLWDGGRTSARVAEADARQAAMPGAVAGLRQPSRSRGATAIVGFSRRRRAAIPAATEAVRSAAEARRVVDERFAAGVATSTDALDAQTVLLQAELDRTRSPGQLHAAGRSPTRASDRTVNDPARAIRGRRAHTDVRRLHGGR